MKGISHASLIGQRAPREPLIRLNLTQLEGAEIHSCIKCSAFDLFQEYNALKSYQNIQGEIFNKQAST